MAEMKHYRVHGISIGTEKNTSENVENILVAFHEGADVNLKLKYPATQKEINLDEAPLHEIIRSNK